MLLYAQTHKIKNNLGKYHNKNKKSENGIFDFSGFSLTLVDDLCLMLSCVCVVEKLTRIWVESYIFIMRRKLLDAADADICSCYITDKALEHFPGAHLNESRSTVINHSPYGLSPLYRSCQLDQKVFLHDIGIR